MNEISQVVAFQGLGAVEPPQYLLPILGHIRQAPRRRDWPLLYQNSPLFQEMVRWGQNILDQRGVLVEGQHLNLVQVCTQGPLPFASHSPTVWEQPLIYLASIAAWKVRKEQIALRKGTVFVGLSMGEWLAVRAAGCLNEDEGFMAVVWRGISMSEAKKRGTSLLVTGRDPLRIGKLRIRCKWEGGDIWIGNINSPTQVVISGDPERLATLAKTLAARHPELTIRWFHVSEAVHTPFMEPARRQHGRFLKEVNFREPEFPVLCNADGKPTRDPGTIKRNLLRQTCCRLDFRKAAKAIPPSINFHEICVVPGHMVVAPLVEQTHKVLYAPAGKLIRIPFPA